MSFLSDAEIVTQQLKTVDPKLHQLAQTFF